MMEDRGLMMEEKSRRGAHICHYEQRHSVSILHLLLFLLSINSAAAQAPRSPQPPPIEGDLRVTTIAKNLEHPWSIEFLPDGRMLVSERPGRLRRVERDARISEPLSGVPQVYARGQGGLLDIGLSPSFQQDQLVYLSYAEPGNGGAGTAVARGRLGERGLENVQVIWRQTAK